MLFGGVQNPMGAIYLPIKSERVDHWVTHESGITRASIAVNNTMYPYFVISYTSELHTEIEKVLNGGDPALTHDRKMTLSSRRSWLKYLRYCPLCVADDIAEYGETYWHRKHQFPGSYFCNKHKIRFVDSLVTTKQTIYGFYPASSETRFDVTNIEMDIFDKYKDKCLKIGQESEWLLENGLSVDWQENGRDKYLRLFRDSGIASIHGTRCDPYALYEAVNDYWSSEFLNALFSATPIYIEGFSRVHVNMMSRFLPLQHILLMCIAKGSAENFVKCEASESPFGNAPYVCQNPICKHYQVDGAVCTEVRSFNSRMIGFFHCRDCGMKYKKTKSKSAKGIPVILDYGHLWTNELIRCSEDKNISIPKTAEILKCDKSVIILQMKKRGLQLRPRPYSVELGSEMYYKSRIVAFLEDHGEVTTTLVRKEIPQAYDYLNRFHKDWLREHLTSKWETKEQHMLLECSKEKVKAAIAHIKANPPKRLISYGYIGELSGLPRDYLRLNPRIRVCVEGVVEGREDWFRRRIKATYFSKPTEDRPFAVFAICRAAGICSKTIVKYRELFEEVVNELNANK